MTATIDIALAGPEDAEAVTAMLGHLAAGLGAADKFHSTPADIARHGSGPDAIFRALIARDGGHAVGLSLFFPNFSTWHGRPGVYVQDLWVAPETRGQRLGERLLAATARHAAASWGAAYLKLSVDAANTGARRFYQRLGFAEQVGDRPMILGGAGFAGLAEGGA